jgi:hypothetical protein
MRVGLRAQKGNREFLYDLVWLTYGDDGFRMTGVPLVLECEWGRLPDVDYDFEKLLLARADHRVMIFQGTDPEQHFNRMIERVRHCGLTRSGDRYLLLCFDWAVRRFTPRLFVAAGDKAGNT